MYALTPAMGPLNPIASVAKAVDSFKSQPTPDAPPRSGLLGGENASIGPASPAPEMPPMPAPAPAPAPMPPVTPPRPQMSAPAPMPAPSSPAPVMPEESSEYDDNARRKMLDMIANRGVGNQIGAGFAGLGDVLTNAYGKGGQNTMDKTVAASAQAEEGIKGDFEKGANAESKLKEYLRKKYTDDRTYNHQLSRDKINDQLKREEINASKESKNLRMSEKEDQYNNTKVGQWRSQLQGHEVYKNWAKIQSVKQMAQASVKDPSPYGDLQLIYSTITAFDPESTVREGELQLFKGAQSVKQALGSALRTAYSGKRLDDSQRANIMALINNYDKSASDMLKLHAEPLRKQMEAMKLPMEQIDPTLSALYQNNQAAPAAAPDVKEVGGKQYKKVNGKWYAI